MSDKNYSLKADQLSEEVKQFIIENNIVFGWSKKATLSDFNSSFSRYSPLYIEDKLVGYMGWQEIFEEANINFVFLQPDWRGEGLSHLLFETGLKAMTTAGIERVNLEVRAQNFPALALYRKFHFKELDCRPNYYTNPVDDALIMQKEISLND